MTLRLTNTLTRSKQDFVPLDPPRVSIYCCGVTVYDLCHLGHARSYIVWDVLRRYLLWRGYVVTFIQNFTDIDDKILRRAAEEGGTMESVSERNIQAYFQDMDALNILRADRMPRATRCLDAIRAMISELQQRGAAYAADGDVFFSVLSRRDYGKLSGRSIEEQREGASGRTGSEEEARKRHPFDFALWKGARPEEPGFPSPWGPGRPGWHIECSAMVRQELGETIDIHLGGADLIFPHHENEIAQSETATGRPLAQVWLHNGMVNVGGEKMSKSLGNFTTIRALLASGVSPMTLRLFVLQAHYRKPLDFTAAALEAAAAGWKGLHAALAVGRSDPLGWSEAAATGSLAEELPEELQELRARFLAAMDDDLNTAVALGELFELARPLRGLAGRLRGGAHPDAVERQLEARWRLLVELAGVLGLVAETAEQGAPAAADGAAAGAEEETIRALLQQRLQARQQRQFARADQLREQLQALGLTLFDRGGVGISTTASGGPLRQPLTVELAPPD
ncbi:MAG: cysteine--tRNA ligase [Synechococcus sp.]|nr:cysteine--tRNA ligase [Synechococcus sp.]